MKKLFFMLSLLVAVILPACSKNTNAVSVPKFDSQLIELDNVNFEIPKGWEKIDVPSNMKQLIYAPKGADLSTGVSNVSFIMAKTSDKPATVSQLKKYTSKFEEQIKDVFPEATNFKFNSFKSKNGDVFTIEYQVPYGELTLTQTQYYILLEKYVVVITATDIGDNISPTVDEVANHIIQSLQIKTK